VDTAVIGLGLIGGSLLRALAAAGHRVVGFDIDPATRSAARRAAHRSGGGGTWRVAETVETAVENTGLVVLAVPLPALPDVWARMTGAGHTGLVTDVTSVKEPVRALAGGRHRFVGGHPMAGRETSGFAAADPGLFTGCAWVLCLESETVLADWLDLAHLLTSLGARVVPATAAEHDRAVATVSHVPHLVAAALVDAAAGDPLAALLAAGSYADGTRVAASSPDLVAAMCGGNAPSVGPALDAVLDVLRAQRATLDGPEPVAALRPLLAPASAVRRSWPPAAGVPGDLPATADALLAAGRAGGWVTAVADDRRSATVVRPDVPAARN
jgi:prephenate dehydrogenase